MQKRQHTRPREKRELPAHMVPIARAVAKAQGRPYGEVADALISEAFQRDEQSEVRAYAAANTSNLPDPIPDARPPHTPAAGPRDQARLNERGDTAQRAYLDAGETRDLCEVVVKSPEWYRRTARDWRDPERAIRRLQLSPEDRKRFRAVCTRDGKAWGEWGRGAVACLSLIFRLAQRTKRTGVQVLAGCSAGLLASCIPSASGRHHTLSAQTLSARRHAGAEGVPGSEGRYGGLAGDCRRHECGYIEAFRQLGLVFAFQPRSDAVPRWQLGRRGYSCLQFIFPDSVWCTPPDPHPPPG